MIAINSTRVFRNTLTRKPGFSLEKFKQQWESPATLKEIADSYGVSQALISTTACRLKFKSRAELADDAAMEWTPEDPTLDEIVERAAEIRMQWSEEERQRRMSRQSAGVFMRRYVYSPRNFAFFEATP